MIYQQFGRRDPLYVLAVPSWIDWIPPFLGGGSRGPNMVCWDKLSPPPTRLLASLDDTVFLLSHHDTLLRDARFAHRTTNVLAQPEAVAQLAHDKRRMARLAAAVPGLLPIPDLTIAEADDALASGLWAGIAVKDRSGTEGKNFHVVRDREQLRHALGSVGQDRALLQPALEGVEYSVNLICDGASCRVYAPVFKGSNAGFSTHPAKRMRMFPAPGDPIQLARLMSLAAAYAVAAGARGLLEVEFIDTGAEVFLLEINPRLSATLRMCIAGSDENILLALSQILDGGLGETRFVAPSAAAVEMPLPPQASRDTVRRLFDLGNVQISTRITLTAGTADELDDLRRQATHILRDLQGVQQDVEAR